METNETSKGKALLDKANIVLGQASETPEAAIVRCGRMLVDSGYAEERYIEGMLAREASLSTAIGNRIAIPHGELAYKHSIYATGLTLITYPEGIDWHGREVNLVVGIAAKGDEHIEILEKIVDVLEEEADVLRLVREGSVDSIYESFAPGGPSHDCHADR